MKNFVRNLLGDMMRKKQQQYNCSVCGTQNAVFLPLPDIYWENSRRYGYAYFGQGEMTSLQTYICSSCGASDRERLYALWLDRQLRMNLFPSPARFIHFAPEPALSGKLRQISSFEYVTADLSMDSVDHKIDLHDMPFDDDSFDFFLCSHVMEHVENDAKAMGELFRITRPGGAGILMAPIIVGLKHTIEDPNIKDDAERWKYFGQNDHVRLYAHNDYVNRIKKTGFTVRELDEKYFGKKIFRSLGLKQTSILYVVSK